MGSLRNPSSGHLGEEEESANHEGEQDRRPVIAAGDHGGAVVETPACGVDADRDAVDGPTDHPPRCSTVVDGGHQGDLRAGKVTVDRDGPGIAPATVEGLDGRVDRSAGELAPDPGGLDGLVVVEVKIAVERDGLIGDAAVESAVDVRVLVVVVA